MAEAATRESSKTTLPISERRAISYAEAEAYAGLSRVTLWRRVRAGELRTFKLGQRCLIDRASLDAMLDAAASDGI